MNVKDIMKSIGSPLGVKSRDGLVDAAAIRELAELLKETGLTEIEIEQNGARLRVSNQAGGAAVAASAPAPAPAPTVAAAPAPAKPRFISVGQTVKEGDTLFIVEAMKTMNPIIAPRGGLVGEICVHDAQPIEFGQALCILN